MDNSRTARQATHWELRVQKKARTTEEELGRCHQTRPQTDGPDLGRSRGTGELQNRMSSTFGPMQRSRCGL